MLHIKKKKIVSILKKKDCLFKYTMDKNDLFK